MLTKIGDEGPRAIDEAIHRKLADLGTIRIRMWRVQVIDSHVRRSSKIVPSMSQTEFSEKAVKGRAISHCVRYAIKVCPMYELSKANLSMKIAKRSRVDRRQLCYHN